MKIFKTFKFIFATVLLMIGTGARAYDFTVDGMYYKVVSLSDLTCEVTDFGQYSGNIVIPSKVMYNNRTLTVIGIGNYAFNGCSGLTSITIPNSVTRIGDYAFYECSGLETLIIEDGIEPFSMYYSSGASDVSIFEDCPLKTLYLGRNITYSSKRPSYYKTVTEVTIGNSVTRICNRMFSGCSRLASITIPNSVTSIGSSSFYGCI